MKKPEPWPVIICRPCGAPCPLGMPGMPNWRKNFSIWLLSPNDEPSLLAVLASGSIFTRTEITAGFTRAIRSAKPARGCTASTARAAVPPSVTGW